ncbi:MAG: hypothetical protein IK081_14000 [Lachnospiraceae bacterium]|nr:hypothetical protein [Lachnospiraceae bacterium]
MTPIQIKPPRSAGDRSGEQLTDEKIKVAVMEDFNQQWITMMILIGCISLASLLFVFEFFCELLEGHWLECIAIGIVGAIILTVDYMAIRWIRGEKARRMTGQFSWRLAKVIEKDSHRGENGVKNYLHLEQNDQRYSNPEIIDVKASLFDSVQVGTMVYVVYFKTNKMVAGPFDYVENYPSESDPGSKIVRCDFCGTANPYGQSNCKNCGSVLMYSNDYIIMQQQGIQLQEATKQALEAEEQRTKSFMKGIVSVAFMWLAFPILMFRMLATFVYLFLYFIAKTEPLTELLKQILYDVLSVAVIVIIFWFIYKFGDKNRKNK